MLLLQTTCSGITEKTGSAFRNQRGSRRPPTPGAWLTVVVCVPTAVQLAAWWWRVSVLNWLSNESRRHCLVCFSAENQWRCLQYLRTGKACTRT